MPTDGFTQLVKAEDSVYLILMWLQKKKKKKVFVTLDALWPDRLKLQTFSNSIRASRKEVVLGTTTNLSHSKAKDKVVEMKK